MKSLLNATSRCPFLNGGCRLRGVLFNGREAFFKELDAVTLDQIVGSSDKIHFFNR